MATVSIPVLAWTASLLATAATAVSGSLTTTVNITQGWEIQIPVAVSWKSAVSADAVVNAYPSNDGGATFDINPAFSISIARVTGGKGQTSIRLPVGQWALQVLNSGPSTGSASIGTQMVVTAILNQ
jgi:hypothetical protein